MAHALHPIKRLTNGEIAVEQHDIGNYTISYNPDDNRFHISQRKDIISIATFAGNPKGYANALYYIREQNKF